MIPDAGAEPETEETVIRVRLDKHRDILNVEEGARRIHRVQTFLYSLPVFSCVEVPAREVVSNRQGRIMVRRTATGFITSWKEWRT
jgi:hypothetical protein